MAICHLSGFSSTVSFPKDLCKLMLYECCMNLQIPSLCYALNMNLRISSLCCYTTQMVPISKESPSTESVAGKKSYLGLTSGTAGRGIIQIKKKREMFNLYIRLSLTNPFFKIFWSLDITSQPDCTRVLPSLKLLDKIYEAENDKRDKKKISFNDKSQIPMTETVKRNMLFLFSPSVSVAELIGMKWNGIFTQFCELGRGKNVMSSNIINTQTEAFDKM